MTKRELNDQELLKIHADRIVKRQIDELVGLAKGALLDGVIEENEARGIYSWLQANALCLNTWPANVLFRRLQEMFADNRIDEDESGELLGLLMQIAAPDGRARQRYPNHAATNIPRARNRLRGQELLLHRCLRVRLASRMPPRSDHKGWRARQEHHEEARLPDHRFGRLGVLAALELWDEDHEGGAV